MATKTQLTLPGLPSQRGGARQGAGRKRTAPKTTNIRVAEAIAFDCKRMDEQFRDGLYKLHPHCITVATPVHAGTRPWLKRYAEEKGLTENEAACELVALSLARHYVDEI